MCSAAVGRRPAPSPRSARWLAARTAKDLLPRSPHVSAACNAPRRVRERAAKCRPRSTPLEKPRCRAPPLDLRPTPAAMARAATSPRRPHSRRPALLAAPPPPPPPDTLKARLEELLRLLPEYAARAGSAAAALPEHARRLFADDGPLAAARFWRDNRENAGAAADALLDAGAGAVRGDADAFSRAAARLDLRWLRDAGGLPRMLNTVALAALDALTPWDFDRHDFGLTFANTWVDANALPPRADGLSPVVKLTSTIKPLEGEWKLTARSRLVEIGEGGVVFGKAGIYLVGEQPSYVGVEADRVWNVPRLEYTKVFANVNYRSSRKPQRDPVRASFGVQQDFLLGRGMELTLRIGVDPMDEQKFFVTPVPNGSYF